MSGTLYSCIAKSYDGGQSFCDFQQMQYKHLLDMVAFENNAVKINSLPSGQPITDVWAAHAVDSPEVMAYARIHGRRSCYSGLKPRWILVNLAPHNLWTNFTVSNDLMLENIIALRGKPNDECAMIVGRSLGGACVDYNMYPLSRNCISNIESNWSWWKCIEFIMQVWLLSDLEDAIVVYQVLLDYNDSTRPDRPTSFTYAVRFVAKEATLQPFLATCFQNIATLSHDQPADFQKFYAYSLERLYLSKTLKRMKRLTWERLQLEDKVKDGLVNRATSLFDGSSSSFKEQIQTKWDNLQAVAEEVRGRAAKSIASSFHSKGGKAAAPILDLDDVHQPRASRSDVPDDHLKKLVMNKAEFNKGRPLKNEVDSFIKEVLKVTAKLVNATWLVGNSDDSKIVLLFQSVHERNLVMSKNAMLRRVGSRVYFTDFIVKYKKGPRAKSQPRPANSGALIDLMSDELPLKI